MLRKWLQICLLYTCKSNNKIGNFQKCPLMKIIHLSKKETRCLPISIHLFSYWYSYTSLICSNGYRHDLTYLRYRNCNQPSFLFPVLLATQLLFLLFLFPDVFTKYVQATSIAKPALLSLLLCLMFYLIFWMIFLSFDFAFNSYSFFALYFVIAFLIIGDGIAVYSMVSLHCSVLICFTLQIN